MRSKLIAIIAMFFIVNSARAEEMKLTVNNMHICCKGCIVGINNALKGVDGVQSTVEKENSLVKITAKDAASAQKAVDALAAAGYHGKTDNKEIAMKDNSGAPDGKVTRLEITGAHNCCDACAEDMDKAVKSVAGVKSDTAKGKLTTFVVEGDFEAKAVVKALNDAGFHATVKAK